MLKISAAMLIAATLSLVLARKPYTLKRTSLGPVSTLEEDDSGLVDPPLTNKMSAELHDSSMSSRQFARIQRILQAIFNLVRAILGMRSIDPNSGNSLKGTINDCKLTAADEEDLKKYGVS